MYHNHDTEFTQCYRGIPQLQLIAANSENLTFELDCGWAAYAGADRSFNWSTREENLSSPHQRLHRQDSGV